MSRVTTTTNPTSLALVPQEGEESVAQFLETLHGKITNIFALVDERRREHYDEGELTSLRTIQLERFEDLLGKMTHFHHACISTLGMMLVQAELLDLPSYTPSGRMTLIDWATRHIGMTRSTFEQAYQLGKALPFLTELGVPQEVIESAQFTPDKATHVLRLERDLGRQKKPIYERLVADRLEETGQESLTLEEQQALDQVAYETVKQDACATVINMVTNRTDDDLRREQERASGVKDRAPIVIEGISYRRLPDNEDEGLGILSGKVSVIISDEQVEALQEGKYYLSFIWGDEGNRINARALGERIAEQVADELDALDAIESD